MPHVPGPPKRDPIEVIEVGEAPVPFLRPFDWVATSLRSFRERPLPGTYTTEAAPGFDLFAMSRVGEMRAEVVNGGVDNIEITGARVDALHWRQYISVSVSHDDLTSRVMTLTRVIQDDTLGFPILPFAVSESLAADLTFNARLVTVPPLGRIGATVPAISLGNQLFLRALFIEYDIGEPSGDVS